MFGELAGERADRTAALRAARPLEGHERIGPGAQPVERVELREQRGLAAKDVVGDGTRDRSHEVVAVGEIVVELALGRVRSGANGVE